MITPEDSYPKLAKALGIQSIFLKREDLHPYGSHKGRSIPFMIEEYIKKGFIKFALPSSGNAALAAAKYIKEINKKSEDKISLNIFVGNNIRNDKLKKLEELKDENISVTMHERPIQAFTEKIKEEDVKSLRQSIDDTALLGYESLARELLEIKDLKAVFIPTSSGTTAQALAEYFIKEKKDIEIHIVQTSSCHPIADEFIEKEMPEEKSIADAIVDKTANRREAVAKAVKETVGGAWIASNEEIKSAQVIVKENTDIEIGTNSALSVAGLMEAVYTGKEWNGPVACIVTGD